MWKETTATEPPRTTAQDAQKPVTEEELRAIFDRLDTARDVFSQNRELREVLSRRESETRGLREVLSRPRNRDPGIAEPQRGVGRDLAEIRPDAVGRGNNHGIGGKRYSELRACAGAFAMATTEGSPLDGRTKGLSSA